MIYAKHKLNTYNNNAAYEGMVTLDGNDQTECYFNSKYHNEIVLWWKGCFIVCHNDVKGNSLMDHGNPLAVFVPMHITSSMDGRKEVARDAAGYARSIFGVEGMV